MRKVFEIPFGVASRGNFQLGRLWLQLPVNCQDTTPFACLSQKFEKQVIEQYFNPLFLKSNLVHCPLDQSAQCMCLGPQHFE